MRRRGRIALIAGLSISAWLLVLASVGIGLGIAIAYRRAHRGRDS